MNVTIEQLVRLQSSQVRSDRFCLGARRAAGQLPQLALFCTYGLISQLA